MLRPMTIAKLVACLFVSLACGCRLRESDRVASQSGSSQVSAPLYGYVVMKQGASALGFRGDTIPELRPTEVPADLRKAVREEFDRGSSSPDSQQCTRFFGNQAPYVVVFVARCPTDAMITDNTVVTFFVADSSGHFSILRRSDLPWADIEPAWRNKDGRGGGVTR